MKKFVILLITAIAVVGAILIYNHFDKLDIQSSQTTEILHDYTLIEGDEILFQKTSIDEIIKNINTKTGIIFLCTPDSMWCQYYAKYLNEIAISKDIDVIYYADIKLERNINSTKYQKLVNLLSELLYVDDAGDKRIYMPEVLFVKDGVIIEHDNETSVVRSDLTPSEYWNETNINELKNKLSNYIDEMNQIDVVESED